MQNDNSQTESTSSTRRHFLKTGSAAVTAGTLLSASNLSAAVHVASNETLKVGLIGCGGRGSGAAAQALNADPNTKLFAMGDAFEDRLERSLANLKRNSVGDRVQVDASHRFTGFDAYKGVIESCDVVILTTPPHFRPMQLKAAIEAGKHVFCEKPVAVDAPGYRSVLETTKLAKEKKLTLVSGLCWRYDYGMRATFDQIHEGKAGEIVAIQASYNTRGLWKHPRKPDWSDMEWQVRNWLYFTWLSGDFIAEQHVHSLDKVAWALNDKVPEKVSATGGRQTRTSKEYGHIYDHFAVVYEYDNGVKAFSRCRQQNGCDVDVSDHAFGTKGNVDIFKHRIYDHNGGLTWRFRGKNGNMYQTEHNEMFKAIRSGNPINNGTYMANSTMMAIIGRMAAYTGKTITWEQAIKSEQDLSPKEYKWGPIEVPAVAMPGVTPFT